MHFKLKIATAVWHLSYLYQSTEKKISLLHGCINDLCVTKTLLLPFPAKIHVQILLSITNKMQRYTIFFITVNALHVSGGLSAHNQELKTVHTASGICQACVLLPLAWVTFNSPMLAVAASKLHMYQMLRVQFGLLMMGGETA
jgi:hypothetical protein